MARARREAATAELKELELERRRGELVPLEAVEELIRDAVEPLDIGLRTAHRDLAVEWARRFDLSEGEATAAARELADRLRERLVAACEASVARAQEGEAWRS